MFYFVDTSQKQPDVSSILHSVDFYPHFKKNYCITELQCLDIVDALNKFHHCLFRQKMTMHADHPALILL